MCGAWLQLFGPLVGLRLQKKETILRRSGRPSPLPKHQAARRRRAGPCQGECRCRERCRNRRRRPNISGMAAGRANCACSAAPPARMSIFRRGPFARLARPVRSKSKLLRRGDALFLHHQYAPAPGYGREPHSIAVVTLKEGPRMMTNIVGCPQTPEALQLDMPLKVIFEQQSETITLPFFTPVPGARA